MEKGIKLNQFTLPSQTLEMVMYSSLYNSNNNNNRIPDAIHDFFSISSVCHELSPTCMLKWPRRNRVQTTYNTLSANHMQHVMLRATWYVYLSFILLAELLPMKEGR